MDWSRIREFHAEPQRFSELINAMNFTMMNRKAAYPPAPVALLDISINKTRQFGIRGENRNSLSDSFNLFISYPLPKCLQFVKIVSIPALTDFWFEQDQNQICQQQIATISYYLYFRHKTYIQIHARNEI